MKCFLREDGEQPPGFLLEYAIFQDGGYQTRRIIKYFSIETKNEFICVKLVIILIFCNEKVPFIDFFVKDLNKSLPY